MMVRKPGWPALVRSLFASRRFIFTLVTLAVCGAKGVHLHCHRSSIAPKRMLLFFFSFFTQDILFLLLIRLLLGPWSSSGPGLPRFLVTAITSLLILYNITVGVVSVSFYIVSGSEIHWRNLGFVADPESRAILFSGFTTFILVLGLAVVVAGLLQGFCYGLFGIGAELANWPVTLGWRLTSPSFRSSQRTDDYDEIFDSDDFSHPRGRLINKDDDDLSFGSYIRHSKHQRDILTSLSPRPSSKIFHTSRTPVWARTVKRTLHTLPYMTVTILLTALFTLTFIRPKDSSLIFLSWTSGLLPFVDFTSTSPFLDDLPSYFGVGIQRGWDELSALDQPTPYKWLPKDRPLAGFDDWYTNQTHYAAINDPMKISNLDSPLLQSLRGKLKGISIRNVVFFVLESTRNDVFPIKKDGLIWNRFAETFPKHQLPREVQERLATLTPTANFITGDYDDGFPHAQKPKRGGIRFTDAHTAGTYTLKSLTGTICGVAPLVGDFNLEHSHHIYQPCLPHILEGLNKWESKQSNKHDQQSKWKSYFYQAAGINYDNQQKLLAAMGFPKENTIGQEYLRSSKAKHGPVTLPNINEFAFEEDPLEEYIRDVFVDAKKTNDRVFLTHLTSTSHHRFHMPAKEKYVQMAKGLDMMSRYINTEGYDDRWIRKVLNVLDEQGVANETLIIFLGDHGVSLPENNFASPYYNPNIGVDHVPLVISHPQLPAFDVSDPVQSSQVLPTILDILIETGSLNKASREAAMELMYSYEGQSLLRPLKVFNQDTGQGLWQFTVTNPGRAMLTVRDARYPEQHLVVPIIENVDWRFTNLTSDPRERESVQDLDFVSFLQELEYRYGRDVAEWAEEGAFITRWFVKENSKRWRFDHGGKG